MKSALALFALIATAATSGFRPAPLPPSPAVVPSAKALTAAVTFARSRAGLVSFAIVDSAGTSHGWRQNRAYSSASVVKAMLLVSYLRQASWRGLRLGADTRHELEEMIVVSDNDAASRAYKLVGGDRQSSPTNAGASRAPPAAGTSTSRGAGCRARAANSSTRSRCSCAAGERSRLPSSQTATRARCTGRRRSRASPPGYCAAFVESVSASSRSASSSSKASRQVSTERRSRPNGSTRSAGEAAPPAASSSRYFGANDSGFWR